MGGGGIFLELVLNEAIPVVSTAARVARELRVGGVGAENNREQTSMLHIYCYAIVSYRELSCTRSWGGRRRRAGRWCWAVIVLETSVGKVFVFLEYFSL